MQGREQVGQIMLRVAARGGAPVHEDHSFGVDADVVAAQVSVNQPVATVVEARLGFHEQVGGISEPRRRTQPQVEERVTVRAFAHERRPVRRALP
ncbi:hypothetical protein GCM10023317_57800 [Actinopolymorpha pittospori]